MTHCFPDIRIIEKSETVSTNSDAKEMIVSGEYTGDLIVIADSQSGGRGRQGKKFLSPAGGLYMTLAMRCGIPITEAVAVTSCSAVAVCSAIEKVSGISCGIKWVNDIYANGGKLAGILVEAVNDYEKMITTQLIIGVGVNIHHSPEIDDSSYNAASLADCGAYVSRDELGPEIVRELLGIRERGFDFSEYYDEYISRSVVIGREIAYTQNGETKIGHAVGIDSRGGLKVETINGLITLDSGEISVRVR